MRKRADHVTRILGIDPGNRGFGFVVVEWPLRVTDWGVKATRTNQESATLQKISHLLKRYQPTALVLEDCAAQAVRRCQRIKLLTLAIEEFTKREGVKVRLISNERVKQAFKAFGAVTKHEMAQTVAKHLPDLASSLPRRRRPWMSEQYRMSIFDAAALVLTYFYDRPGRRKLISPKATA